MAAHGLSAQQPNPAAAVPPQGGEGAERLLKAATDAAPASLQPMLASVAARIKTKPADVDTDDDGASESVAAEGWVVQRF